MKTIIAIISVLAMCIGMCACEALPTDSEYIEDPTTATTELTYVSQETTNTTDGSYDNNDEDESEDNYAAHTYPTTPETPTVDLTSFGFVNNYGYTKWLSVDGYSIKNNKNHLVYIKGDHTVKYKDGYGYYVADGIRLYSFSFDDVRLYYDETLYNTLGISTINDNEYSYTIDNIANDIIQYHYKTESYFDNSYSSMEIFERVTYKDTNVLVLKTKKGKHEEWFTPTDLIDWNRSPEYDSENNQTYFYFKK